MPPAEDVALWQEKQRRKAAEKSAQKKAVEEREHVVIRYDVLGKLCVQRRSQDRLSLRDVEGLLGISASTLSRLEHGHTADAEQVVVLCRWLNISVEHISGSVVEDVSQVVRSILLADPRLQQDEAEALGGTFSVLYRQIARDK